MQRQHFFIFTLKYFCQIKKQSYHLTNEQKVKRTKKFFLTSVVGLVQSLTHLYSSSQGSMLQIRYYFFELTDKIVFWRALKLIHRVIYTFCFCIGIVNITMIFFLKYGDHWHGANISCPCHVAFHGISSFTYYRALYGPMTLGDSPRLTRP